MAGMPMERAMMVLWLVWLPPSVAKPSTVARSSRGVAGRNIPGEEDVRQVMRRLVRVAAQHTHYAPRYVLNIRDTLAQVVVVHARHGLHVARHHGIEGTLCALRVALNAAPNLHEQRGILKHEQMSVEDEGVGCARLRGHTVPKVRELTLRFLHPVAKALEFRRCFRSGNGLFLGNIEERRAQAHRSPGDSWRNADPNENDLVLCAVGFLRHGNDRL